VTTSKPENQSNFFDLLRLTAALMVLFSHQFALFGVAQYYNPVFNGELGVIIFFAISGYLNGKSLLLNPSGLRFLMRRARRIYPALIGAALFTAALGSIITTATPSAFWPRVPAFIAKNSTILFGIDYSLPGVFDQNPFPSAINGSLWTLPHEIKLYVYLAMIAVAARYRPRIFLLILAAFFAGFAIWFHLTSSDRIAGAYFNRFAIVFLTGTLFAIIEHLRGTGIALLSTATLAGVTLWTTAPIATLPAIALTAISIGKLPSPKWLAPPMDISYGVYLYAFPVQQLLFSLGLTFYAAMGASACGSIALAILSARFIERPAMSVR
jgi:peptidoglycan/LPS O-acetylase OafA/YrhL